MRSLSPMGVLPTWVEVGSMGEYRTGPPPWLLSAALLLLAIDLVVSLVMRGVFGGRRGVSAVPEGSLWPSSFCRLAIGRLGKALSATRTADPAA